MRAGGTTAESTAEPLQRGAENCRELQWHCSDGPLADLDVGFHSDAWTRHCSGAAQGGAEPVAGGTSFERAYARA